MVWTQLTDNFNMAVVAVLKWNFTLLSDLTWCASTHIKLIRSWMQILSKQRNQKCNPDGRKAQISLYLLWNVVDYLCWPKDLPAYCRFRPNQFVFLKHDYAQLSKRSRFKIWRNRTNFYQLFSASMVNLSFEYLSLPPGANRTSY